MQFSKAKDYILGRLSDELSSNFHYHSFNHTLDVLEAAIIIAKAEGIGDEDLLLIQTAALFHDSGFIYGSVEHESRGCRIARNALPKFDYNDGQIELICGMIMATKIPQNPNNKLEKIICDADLDYLGREDFKDIGDKLYLEFKEQNIVSNKEDWNRLQVKFLSAHNYHTNFSKIHRKDVKNTYLRNLIDLIDSY